MLPFVAFAQNNSGDFDNSSGSFDNNSGGFDNSSGDPNSLQNPLNVDSFPALIEKILQAAIAIGVPISILFIVYAGFKLVWAQGNPTELQKARSNLMYTLVGIGIFVGAAILVSIIVTTLCQVGVEGIGSC